MKKIIALLLACIMLMGAVVSFSSCGKKDAEIAIYLGDQIYDLDPALAFVNDDVAKVMSLIYEPLFRLTDDGKVKKALAKNYKIIEDPEKNLFQMEIELRETYWSDRAQVTADDLYYAWTRILDPEFESQAAPLLYDIKNAVEVKQGLGSRSDIGLEANLDTLTITFERKIDYDAFLRNLCSIALVPLRETKVKANETAWAKKASSIATNGPFSLRTIDTMTGEFSLQRNTYYRSELGDADASDIKPARLVTDWTDENFLNGTAFKGNFNLFLQDKLDSFVENTIFYYGAMPMDRYSANGSYDYSAQRTEYAEDMNVSDMLSTYTYIFNQNNPVFADKNVRKALSMAIDREFIASKLVYYKAADGFIAPGVWETDSHKDSFRDNSESLISTTADLEEAKKLIDAAELDASVMSFSLTVRDNPEEIFIAQYVIAQWSKLGFEVGLIPVTSTEERQVDENSDNKVRDDALQQAYTNGDFDVIGIDYNMYSTNAFTALCSLTSHMNGNGVSSFTPALGATKPQLKPHCSGFKSQAYDELLQKAWKIKDLEKRSVYLHAAETILMEEMPVMPIIYNVNYYLTDGIGGLSVDGFGYVAFTDARLK